MAEASEWIDAYIAAKPDFARPILEHIRALMARHAPVAEEAIKWGMPAWTYRGKLLAGMAAFKGHATLSFWREDVIGDATASREAMGQFGRLTRVSDLPPEPDLAAMIARAAALIDEGAPAPPAFKRTRPDIETPEDFIAALEDAPAAAERWPSLTPSCQRDYLEWIADAKRAATRVGRIEKAIAQIGEGKPLHWKYQPG